MSSILSTDSILREIAYYSDHTADMDELLDKVDSLLEAAQLDEVEYDKVTKRLKLDILDVEKFVKVNDCKCISNPRAFNQNGQPSIDGLLSNEIFGYTMKERSGTFGYIDLHGWFLDPSCYKTWCKVDPAVKNIVHGVKYYRIDDHGLFVEDEEKGETGIDFLRKNIKRIKFKPNESLSKDLSLRYLEMNRDRMFIQKYIVIPAFYRDKNTSSGSRKVVGLGGINKLYNNLIVASNGLVASQEYGFDATDAMKGRVQELILTIYDWFCGNNNPNLGADAGQGMSGKLGLMRRTNMSKTANYSTRLVISAAELKANRPEDLMVDYDHAAIPLYAAVTQFRDFVMYHSRLFFENEFVGAQTYPVVDKNGTQKVIVPEDPQIVFSDERIKMEMDRFLHGYNNRFVPIEVPVEGTDEVYYMMFKGRGYGIGENQEQDNPLLNRRLTWCDVFYMAAVEATKDKQVLITRFPMCYTLL